MCVRACVCACVCVNMCLYVLCLTQMTTYHGICSRTWAESDESTQMAEALALDQRRKTHRLSFNSKVDHFYTVLLLHAPVVSLRVCGNA